MTLVHIGARQNHFGTHGLELLDFFCAHFIRHHQRQTEAGIACSGFNDGAAGTQLTAALCRFYHRQCYPVFDRPTRILAFQFDIQLTGAGIDIL
jgi:hypothetical protein